MAAHDPRPDEGYWRLVEPVWRSVSIYDGSEAFLEQFACLRPEVGHLLAAHWCQSEVRNGGLHQFFMNGTGVLAPEAAAGFEAIGIPEWAAILVEAMDWFGAPYPRDKNERWAMLAAISPQGQRIAWDPFSDLDERFYAWLQAEDNRWCRVADTYATRVEG